MRYIVNGIVQIGGKKFYRIDPLEDSRGPEEFLNNPAALVPDRQFACQIVDCLNRPVIRSWMVVEIGDAHILQIPVLILSALIQWARHGRRPGQFLTFVLENNLVEAYRRADSDSTAALPAIVSFLQSDMPAPCWGSPENVASWETRLKPNEFDEWHGDTPRWELVEEFVGQRGMQEAPRDGAGR